MMKMKSCPHCGEALHPDAHFCPACMEKLTVEKQIPKSAVRRHRRHGAGLYGLCAAGLLAVLLAGLLIYRYYTTPAAPESVSVWTMQLRPNGGVDSFAFCRENGIVGFGWGLAGTPETVTDYRRLRVREGAYPGDKELDHTLDCFENMVSKDFVNLVWTRDSAGEYYLCEITGGYQYCRDEAHERAGIVNFTACSFHLSLIHI